MKRNSKIVITAFVGLAWPVGSGCQSGAALPEVPSTWAHGADTARVGAEPRLRLGADGVEEVLAPELGETPFEALPPGGAPTGGGIGLPGFGSDGTVEVPSAELFGDLGAVRGFSGPVSVLSAHSGLAGSNLLFEWRERGFEWLEGDAWVQASLDVTNLDLLGAPAGRYQTDPLDASAPTVTMQGASGRGSDLASLTSSRAVLSISDEPDGARKLQVEAEFTAADGSVQEAFLVATVREGSIRPIVISGALMSGDLGDIAGYGADSSRVYGTYSTALSSIRLDAEGPGWWVMNYLNVSGLDLRTVAAGVYRSDAASGVVISAVGCSGPSYGTYTYDSSVDEGEIQIEDGEDGERSVGYAMIFPSADGLSSQVARGTFRFRVAARR